MPPLRLALITTEERETHSRYNEPGPQFGVAPSALLEGLARSAELEVHVITCVRRRVSMPESIAGNVFCHTILVPSWGFLRTAYLPCILKIRALLKRIRPDIVHGQGTERYCALAAAFSGWPNIVTLHGNMLELSRVAEAGIGTYPWAAARLENLALRRAGGVFCNSTHTRKSVSPRAKRTWLVPNPVRDIFFISEGAHSKPERPLLLNVGAVCENKQQLKLLQMARSLWQQKLDFELQFIGMIDESTSYGERFLDEVGRAEQDGFACYLGSKRAEELVGLFDDASALVHIPVSESFGLVVAEALARNLKIFGFRVGGVPDITESASGAVLLDANDWAALAKAVANWLQTGSPPPETNSALMRSRYHHDAVARRHVEIYRQILEVSA